MGAFIARFKKMSNYDLVIVLSMDGINITIITVYYADKKRENRYKRWQDSQK